MGDTRKAHEVLVRNPEGRNHFEVLGTDGTIILKWVFKNKMGVCGLDSSGLGQEPMAASCEYSNESLDSIKLEFFN
jgi:hypothetical protein